MLVFGDRQRRVETTVLEADVQEALQRSAVSDFGLSRHAALVDAFIAAAKLVQGLADDAFHRSGCDLPDMVPVQAMDALMSLAAGVVTSWRSSFAEIPVPALARGWTGPHRKVCTRAAEGYSFYALYPEGYAEAAFRSGLPPQTRIIGIRSIGTGLAAIVAAALGAPAPWTVRPKGHPFRREIAVDRELSRAVMAERDHLFAVVDEGPGLSGSSFGAVIDWLEACGVERRRIHVFPGHAGDLGPQAHAAHRERWATLPRHVVSFEELVLQGANQAHRLSRWLEDLVGEPAAGALEDISGGAWRARRYRHEAYWPASNIQQERRKFLFSTGSETFLGRFVGLGESGAAALRRAVSLSQAGFTPPVLGLVHGFLVERWLDGEGLDASDAPASDTDRQDLIIRIADYLAFRACHLPASEDSGASLPELYEMAMRNAGLALGPEASGALAALLPEPECLPGLRRVATDNRLMLHEWIRLTGGALLKTDGVDHCAAHDLIGCQDVAWDIAGAAEELDLSPAEAEMLRTMVEHRTGWPIHRAILKTMRLCYLAFQLGASTLAAEFLGGKEADRLATAAHRYGTRLSNLLAQRLE
ncbi:hypothetical protein [Microvirga massiliensis]|uniref:hypothetical protein n=1 Tax=Microvirga massiliensis TaxID=1033741 RepID=UPI00062B9F03|nr:hypothetical protein [Microvirga massiliensis]